MHPEDSEWSRWRPQPRMGRSVRVAGRKAAILSFDCPEFSVSCGKRDYFPLKELRLSAFV